MPELARNRRTGTVHVAAELPFSPELDSGGWECPGCRVEMIPVAASGAQHYKVAPHFRVHGDHANNCNALGESPGGATALSTAEDIDDEPPDTFPRALRLAVNRTDGTGDQPAALTPANAGTPKATGAHLAQGSSGIAGTLHRIAEAYLLAPQHHGQPLQIDGCEGTTYETCFRRLKNASQAARLPRLIWFAEIQFRHIVRDGDTAEVTLSPLLWMRERAIVRPGPHYRTRFDMGTWNERRRSAMLAELDRRRAEQRELHHTEAEERVTMFFFGRQDQDDPMLFHVEDPRLVCFFRMPGA